MKSTAKSKPWEFWRGHPERIDAAMNGDSKDSPYDTAFDILDEIFGEDFAITKLGSISSARMVRAMRDGYNVSVSIIVDGVSLSIFSSDGEFIEDIFYRGCPGCGGRKPHKRCDQLRNFQEECEEKQNS